MTPPTDIATPGPHAGTSPAAPGGGDGVSIRQWFALYAAYLLTAGVPLVLLLAFGDATAADWLDRPAATLAAAPAAVKLLAFAIYISLCTTMLPLPANWIVSAVALRQAAVAPGLASTTLVVAAVGAMASTVANLNDYHVFTWMLRSRRVARVRQTRAYRVAAAWFAKAPAFLLVVFNILPIPVDVVRMVAVTYRYPRLPFAAANFAGRFVRYGVIAAVTYSLGEQGKWAVLALLAVAVILAGAKLIPRLVRRVRRERP